MDKQKIIDETHKITDALEHEATLKLKDAQAYYKGYIQACEDYGRKIRMMVIAEGEKD